MWPSLFEDRDLTWVVGRDENGRFEFEVHPNWFWHLGINLAIAGALALATKYGFTDGFDLGFRYGNARLL